MNQRSQTMDDIAAKATPITGVGIPSGPQSSLVIYAGDGVVKIAGPGPAGAPFNLFFVYESSGAPPTLFQVAYNGEEHTLRPGQYPLQNIDASGVIIWYQLEQNQRIKLVWIYD
jgi:hypothetical protein